MQETFRRKIISHYYTATLCVVILCGIIQRPVLGVSRVACNSTRDHFHNTWKYFEVFVAGKLRKNVLGSLLQ